MTCPPCYGRDTDRAGVGGTSQCFYDPYILSLWSRVGRKHILWDVGSTVARPPWVSLFHAAGLLIQILVGSEFASRPGLSGAFFHKGIYVPSPLLCISYSSSSIVSIFFLSSPVFSFRVVVVETFSCMCVLQLEACSRTCTHCRRRHLVVKSICVGYCFPIDTT